MRFLLAAFFIAFSYFSCSSIEHSATCSGVCQRYGDCFDDELDVDDCTADCLDDAGANDRFRRDVDRCESCMDMEGCRESAFDCFDECGKIIGETAVDP